MPDLASAHTLHSVSEPHEHARSAELESDPSPDTACSSPDSPVHPFTPAPNPAINPWKARQDLRLHPRHAPAPASPHPTDSLTESRKHVTRWSRDVIPKSHHVSRRTPATDIKFPSFDDSQLWPTPEKAATEVREHDQPKLAPAAAPPPKSLGKDKWVHITPTITHNHPLPPKGPSRGSKAIRAGRSHSVVERSSSSSDASRVVKAHDKESRKPHQRNYSVDNPSSREPSECIPISNGHNGASPVIDISRNAKIGNGEKSNGTEHVEQKDISKERRPSRASRGRGSYHSSSSHSLHTSPTTGPHHTYPHQYRQSSRANSVPIYNRYSTNGYDYPANMAPVNMTMMQPFSIPDVSYIRFVITSQVEYYFSIDNLCKDIFLRRHMDSQGFVPLSVLANFNRMRAITTDFNLLKDCCLRSSIVELQHIDMEMVRKREDWEIWVLPVDQRNQSSENCSPEIANPHPQMSVQAPPFEPHSKDRGNLKLNLTAPAFVPRSPLFQQTLANNSGSTESMFSLDEELHPNVATIDEIEEDFSDDAVNRLILVTQRRKSFTKNSLVDALRSEVNGSYSTLIDEGLLKAEQAGQSDPSNGLALRSKRFFPYEAGASPSNIPPSIDGKPMHPGEVGWFMGSHKYSAYNAADSPDSISSFFVPDRPDGVHSEHPSHELLRQGSFMQHVYHRFHAKSLADRAKLGPGKSKDMNLLFRFWGHFLRDHWNNRMYNDFKCIAVSDANLNQRYGLECLLRFYRNALQRHFRKAVFNDFCSIVLTDCRNGSTYGLEGLWALLEYFKATSTFQDHKTALVPELEHSLSKFQKIEDFDHAASKVDLIEHYQQKGKHTVDNV
ncbi:La-related protein 1 [Neolecta irregularis DAH-3]|uniref:La-related protein 1 n=1 Tax=Neolecta irregularis (strain DAH-3) TaxID=1198029 RepID=A0A1U7LPQ9_NEOID|nr:La-related protein 1 [Neolecta irregularis DAH-3]|eukprot:OLL24645.1 La-related protein 1 [Neolecta irregularis DAH-3]